jgi:hypothetical protein
MSDEDRLVERALDAWAAGDGYLARLCDVPDPAPSWCTVEGRRVKLRAAGGRELATYRIEPDGSVIHTGT